MDGNFFRLIVVGGLAASAVLWVLASVVWRVGGVWERVLSAAERDAGAQPEQIVLAQLGPLVMGRRDVVGGYQELTGLVFGPVVRLHRRDHGVRALTSMGFPEPVAKKLDGEIMARLDLKLRDGALLDGTFAPQKVEFTHQPPRITRAYFLPPQPRRYRRVDTEAVVVQEPAAS
jgi:hypothetical protein